MKVTDIPKNLTPHKNAGIVVFLPGKGMFYAECGDAEYMDDEERSQHDESNHRSDNEVLITACATPPDIDFDSITFRETDGGIMPYSSETYPTGDVRDLLVPALGYMGWPTDLTPYLLVGKTGRFAKDHEHGEEGQ